MNLSQAKKSFNQWNCGTRLDVNRKLCHVGSRRSRAETKTTGIGRQQQNKSAKERPFDRLDELLRICGERGSLNN